MKSCATGNRRSIILHRHSAVTTGSRSPGEEISMFIEWKESFATGIAEFDDHHRKLIDLLNSSYFMIIEGNGQEELQQLLDGLLDYTRYHFEAEEAMMRAKDYRKLDEHMIEHINFTHGILSFARQARAGQQFLPIEIFDFVRNWFVMHVVTSDAEMSRAVRFR